MGFRIGWLAVRGKEAQRIHAELGLSAVDHVQADYPPDDPISGAPLRRGWYLVNFNEYDHPLMRSDRLKRLSEGAELFGCHIHETVMVCSTEYWRDGHGIWRVEHDAQIDLNHLESQTHAPAHRVLALKNRALSLGEADKGEVDHMFDVPMLLAWRDVGFKHDKGLRRARTFNLLSAAEGGTMDGPKPWWKFW